MSVRIQKAILLAKNFQNIMKKIFKNKKAAAGMIILIFFGGVALIGPFVLTDDPIGNGSVPAGSQKMPVAAAFCGPGWYTPVFGGNYTNNIYVTPNPSFSDPSKLQEWHNSTTDPAIQVIYANQGEDDQSSIGMIFGHDGNATISIDFDYPYQVPPQQFASDWSSRVDALYPQYADQANFTVYASYSYRVAGTNTTKSFPASWPTEVAVANSPWVDTIWTQTASTSTQLATLYSRANPCAVVFARPRIYTFSMTVQLTRNETAYAGNMTAYGNPSFYIDNLDNVLFGNSFGLLGTDNLARDLFTQLVTGTRISFIIGIVSAVLSVGIGLMVGLVAGYVGGATDEVLMRFNDMLLVIPSLPLVIVLVFVLGQSMVNIIVVVGALGWMGFARTVRSAVLSLKERSFIEAVKSVGGGRGYIIRKHIVPNVFPLIYVTLAMSVPGAIVSEAALSFLGLGPLDVMSWGRILYQLQLGTAGSADAFKLWYWAIPPGVSIALLSLSFVLIGYALDEILNPRLRDR